jgi:signal transduction histidine kinase
MPRKIIKQKYFIPKEVRLSIALIILWSLLITAFFTYFAKELGDKIGHGVLLFVIVMLGYLIIIFILTILFSHRLLGPFQRLKTEIRLIVTGDYHKRLRIRKNDDIYISSFVSEVNNILEEFEKLKMNNKDLVTYVDSELIRMISLIEEGDASKEKLREKVLECHKKLKSLSDEDENN